MRGERGEEREGQREGWREREDIKKETLACLHIPSTDSPGSKSFTCNDKSKQKKKQSNLEQGKGKCDR